MRHGTIWIPDTLFGGFTALMSLCTPLNAHIGLLSVKNALSVLFMCWEIIKRVNKAIPVARAYDFFDKLREMARMPKISANGELLTVWLCKFE